MPGARGQGDAKAAVTAVGAPGVVAVPALGTGLGKDGAPGAGAALTVFGRRRARVCWRCRSSGRSERPRAPARPQQQVSVTAVAAARELKPAAAGGGGLRASERAAAAAAGGGGRGGAGGGGRRGTGEQAAAAGGDRGAGGGSSSRVARDGEIPCHPDVSVMLAQTLRDLAAAKQQRQEEEEQQQPLARL